MSGGTKLGVAVGAAAAVIALCLLAWIGGELHYRNCLQGVELRYPVAYEPGRANSSGSLRRRLEASQGNLPAHFAFYEKPERNRAISSCSRWP